ncbi:hypothetical protein FJY70_02430 [candidate division WOR-3 bacterium]|nr:hypothetical protein [candidate division WOR-3 bacterium]
MPVIHEESIKTAGATKAPDYTFRIIGRRDALDSSGCRHSILPMKTGLRPGLDGRITAFVHQTL